MDELIEKYVSAVCSYFFGIKRQYVYNDLKEHIYNSIRPNDDIEDILLDYGHPRSVALSYGYRPLFVHHYHSHIILYTERFLFSLSGLYLFLSTLFYLEQLNCLPFQTPIQVTSYHVTSVYTWILSKPIQVMLLIGCCSFILLYALDKKYPSQKDFLPKWTMNELYSLPHPTQYPHHLIETVFLVLFIIFFFIYTIVFSSHYITEAQLTSYQMIHLMASFFQPFVMIIIFDYVIDLTKRRYTNKYLRYSFVINIFTLITLTFFVFNSNFLSDYLLPPLGNRLFLSINILIICALIFIYSISLYKLIRNIFSYYSLYK